jgi:mannose/fructose-specific phosphotransferase system component IIA
MSGASADAAPAAAMAGLLVTHGTLGAALKSAAERISGPADDLATFSNEHLSPEELTERLQGHLATLAGPALVMVDLAGGSTLSAAQRACRGRAGVHLLAGVNLPVLLDFLQKRGSLSAAELVAHVLDRGHAGLRLVPPPAG